MPRKTRWINAFLILTFLVSFGAAPALADDSTGSSDLCPDVEESDPLPDFMPGHPTDPEDECVDGCLILDAICWIVSVVL